MKTPRRPHLLLAAAGAVLFATAALLLLLQRNAPAAAAPTVLTSVPAPPQVDSAAARERAVADSIAAERARAEEEQRAALRRRTGPRLVISLEERRLRWMDGQDTLFSAPVGVGKGTRLEYEEQVWTFDTPPGERTVLAKQQDPVWIPPLWHFVEAAQQADRKLIVFEPGDTIELYNGNRLVMRGDTVGQLMDDNIFFPVPPGQQIVFDQTVFVPPMESVNRRVAGELGRFKLDLGDGYLIHGTRDSASIGSAATHGCIRMADDDLAFLYESIPVGTPVFIR